MTIVSIVKKNETYLTVSGEPHVKKELSEYFTFEVPNFKFMPQYKSGMWDGKIRLYSPGTGELYCGLFEYLIKWLKEKNYTYEVLNNKYYGYPGETIDDISLEGIIDFVKTLNVPFTVRDYQYKAIYESIKNIRKLLISPTASGKSLMIYSLIRYYIAKNLRIIIIVPTTSLVEQMSSDFSKYGWNSDLHCHKIYSGKDKNSNKDVTITTWQSIYKLPKKWFEQYDVIIGDEAHLFKAKSLIGILNKMCNCKFRIGFTGTLDGSNTNKLVLEGLFGSMNQITETKKLIDEKHLSDLEIKILLLKHNSIIFNSYPEEIDYICSCERRNKFIRNLCKDIQGNTLLLFSYVDKHGKLLYDLINSHVSQNRKVFLIYGDTDTKDREEIRSITEKESNAIIIASYGTFSTGINIKNLNNVIFASPSKSRIRVLQSIGRVLRKSDNKTLACLYDIADDFSKKNRKNYTLNHLIERIKIYSQENFNYEIIPINIEENN